jgi:hypothetical protein
VWSRRRENAGYFVGEIPIKRACEPNERVLEESKLEGT